MHIGRISVDSGHAANSFLGHADYDRWRNVAGFALEKGEEVLCDRRRHGVHLDCMVLRGEGMEAALERLYGLLAGDAPYLAASLAGRREGENKHMREQRIIRLLDDPEKLDELRKRRAERRAAQSEVAEQRRKGRYPDAGLADVSGALANALSIEDNLRAIRSNDHLGRWWDRSLAPSSSKVLVLLHLGL